MGEANCPKDFIRVFDGGDANAPVLATRYGKSMIGVHSTSNEVYLHFQSDFAVQYAGFQATLRVSDSSKSAFIITQSWINVRPLIQRWVNALFEMLRCFCIHVWMKIACARFSM